MEVDQLNITVRSVIFLSFFLFLCNYEEKVENYNICPFVYLFFPLFVKVVEKTSEKI